MTDADLEQRLRQALAARARAVTAQDLRPVVSERRRAPVRWWLPLSAGLAAVAIVMLIFVVFRRPADPARLDRPIAPAASVPASRPAPTVSSPTAPAPSPSLSSAPTAVPSAAATANPTAATTALPSASTTARPTSPRGTLLPSTGQTGR
jgi:hypothetical protein